MGTLYQFDIEPRYAKNFFEKELRLMNFCGRVRLGIPKIIGIKVKDMPVGRNGTYGNLGYYVEYVCDNESDQKEIWKKIFEFYQDYVTMDFQKFTDEHGISWIEQSIL